MTEYAIVVLPLPPEDGGGFIGFAPDLPGCISDGDTADQALSNTLLAVDEWIDAQAARGFDIPSPGDAARHAKEREIKLLDAIKALAEYGENADSKIRELERKLTELIAVLREDASVRKLRFNVPSTLEIGKIRRPN